MEECNEQKEIEEKNKINTNTTKKENDCGDGLPDDLISKHNIITRLIVFVIIGIFIYSFITPLPIGYAEIITYALIFALLIITFGLNSLKVIGNLIDKWKR